jgi:2-polyprenyl-3-methyl-5-hydroxy-6-metoxy-1,4-benzoquinol methylase
VDQRELYERQIQKETNVVASPHLFGQREAALLDWIRYSMGNSLEKPENRIVELSVGDGQLSRALARAVPNAKIDCVDISPTRLQHCRQLAQSAGLDSRMHFLELNLDTEFDQVPRSNYDVVIAIDVLEHIFDPFHFLRHCCEILKSNGYLFLRVPNIAYIKRRGAILCGHLPITSSWFETPGSFQSWKERHGWDGGHLHFFTLSALRWLLAQEGFESLSWSDVGASGEKIRRLWPGMLFGNLAIFARKMSKRSNASAH